MSYQVIARKWRPQSFADVVGQNHITQTLGNALKNGRLPHAILFTGPRGTGKTSSARILAKSLRCPDAVNFVPCGVCSSCLEIANGTALDVKEIDGASNNGVDNVRELRDSVAFMPSSGKYKIYIIDEVRMLSSAAFNALLKTLEEPPAHVIFIMATTEAQKIPATILSRCQRFDFRRISTRQIVEHLKHICAADNIPVDDEALWVVARQGDGSMRDSQSLLDQVITFANGPLTKDNVVSILGLTDRSLLLETLAALAERSQSKILHIIERLNQAGVEPQLYTQELLEFVRHLLLIKISANSETKLLDLPDSEVAVLNQLSAHLSEEEIHALFDMLLKASQDVQRAQDPRLVLEVVLIRLAAAPRIVDLQKLVAMAAQGSAIAEAGEGSELKKKSSDSKSELTPNRNSSASPAPKKEFVSGSSIEERWLNFVARVRHEDALFAAKLEKAIISREEGKIIRLAAPTSLPFLRDQFLAADVSAKMQNFLNTYWGIGFSFEFVSSKDIKHGESAQSLTEKAKAAKDEELKQKVSEHALVQKAQSVFKGKIKSITELKGN